MVVSFLSIKPSELKFTISILTFFYFEHQLLHADPIVARFRYHFHSKNRPTSRLDRLDWMFSHVLSSLRFLSLLIRPTTEEYSNVRIPFLCCAFKTILKGSLQFYFG